MIIDCKCKKYKFKIPQQDITSAGRNVICEICKEEWFQPFSDPKNNLIDKMNPSSIKNTSKEKLIKKERSLILPITLLFLIIIFLAYQIMIAYKFYILSTYPSMINFYESLEILIEIIKANFNFLKEILNKIKL
jgi:uncharacterized membrane protein (DUF485 family)